ncbi:UDP-N-acetylenolpyruvoylglucosamine reductase [Candidatus Marinamargulisbacteria bacterium SCGC AAA071-K20]|nr:UDP-N-acetylenolpyruvoylglucosamine reductase [Candidatus Marinamargulisbacteria bacterium SCGC AAA071-K20]
MGCVSRLVVLETVADIQAYLLSHDDYFIIGKGSNVVLSDTSKIKDFIKISSDVFPISCSGPVLEAGAGITVNELMKACQVQGLSGLEFMAGVPASVGGMIAMNFGCWGQEISQKLHSILVVDSRGDLFEMSPDMCQFSYRDSLFQHQDFLILKATFLLEESTTESVKKMATENIKKRVSSQPLRGLTFGSIFKNSEGEYAAKILEEVGLKGVQKGNVGLSDQHANFMINYGDASFDEVANFIEEIQVEVLEKKGIKLETEVKLIR